jgi:DNA-binding NarL/FixJ family response regulator
MMRNGILIATPSENVAGIMRRLLLREVKRGYAEDFVPDEFGWTGNEQDLWRMIRQFAPRLVFIETCFEKEDTRDLINRLCERYGSLHIAAFAVGLCDPAAAAQLVSWGAESYLDLHGEEGECRRGVRAILEGGKYIPSWVAEKTAEMKYLPEDEKPFTKQQLKIFRLTVFGKKKNEIGKLLCLSVNTVKTHRQHINRICGGERLIDYIQFGLRRGIITTEELAGINYMDRGEHNNDCED